MRFVLLCVALLVLGCEQPPLDVAPPPKIDNGCLPPKVVAFCAIWCGPCQAAQPKLAWLEKHGVQVVHVDVDKYPDLCKQYGVTSYPTFFVYVCHKDTVRTQDIDEVVACMWWLKKEQGGDNGQTEMPQLP